MITTDLITFAAVDFSRFASFLLPQKTAPKTPEMLHESLSPHSLADAWTPIALRAKTNQVIEAAVEMHDCGDDFHASGHR